MATKNNPGAFDCYNNAEPDEPMFVLLGRDKHAPTLVCLWAALRELDCENHVKVAEARQCAVSMAEWLAKKDKQPVGLGYSAMVAVLELVRAGNASTYFPADTEAMKMLLEPLNLKSRRRIFDAGFQAGLREGGPPDGD